MNKFWHDQNISSFFGVCTKAPHLCHAQKISQHTKYSNMASEMDRKEEKHSTFSEGDQFLKRLEQFATCCDFHQ